MASAALPCYGSVGEQHQECMESRPLRDEANEERRGSIFPAKTSTAALGIVVLFCAAAMLISTERKFIRSFTELLSTSKSTSSPNIIFLLADDMGYNSLTMEVSPFLSQLRDRGISLEKYYSLESCTPARSSLLTGRYALTTGLTETVLESYDGGLNLNETILSNVLKDAGYTTYMFGKWNLGNKSPRYLPTARGFDYFIGFMNALNNYWSKLDPSSPTFHDFMYSDKDCYYMYDGDDLKHYSTHLYRDWAVKWIREHDFSGSPMFMYMAFNAVHDPFGDNDDTFATGIPDSYLNPKTLGFIKDKYKGSTIREYYKALNLLDEAAQSIYDALVQRGVMDNTYFIFASDNGGCQQSGGRNWPLRGQKGTLFEGGVRVEAFVSSPLLPDAVQGSKYQGLFHVSDWFPTILSMAGATYTANMGFELDGVDQYQTLRTANPSEYPRNSFLYNYKFKQGHESNFWESTQGAVRVGNYKLIHTYDSPTAAVWANETYTYSNDDDIAATSNCGELEAKSGPFNYFLFDIENDPNETKNLYLDKQFDGIKAQLYKVFQEYLQRASQVSYAGESTDICEVVWKENGNYVTPWVAAEDLLNSRTTKSSRSYPDLCGFYSARNDS